MKSMIKKHLFTSSVLGLLLGCGSDDSTKSEQEIYLPVDAPIIIELDTPLNTNSLESVQASLTSSVTNRAISLDVSYDADYQQVKFQPEHKLAVNTEYTFSLNSGLTDMSGEAIGSLEWSFTTDGNYEFELMSMAETCNKVCDSELWLIADGGEVRKIADINPTDSSYPSPSMIQYKGLFFLSAEDGTHGRELWVTDGTESYTELFADIVIGPNDSNPGQFTILGDYLYFTANNGTNSGTLWRTDGTPEGTVEIVNPRPEGNPSISDLRAFNNKLVFTAYSDNYGHEIYISNGTAEGTELLIDLNEGDGLSGADFLFELNNELFFYGSDGNDTENNPEHHSYSLFKTDGTTEGTVLVKDINPTEISSSEANIKLSTKLGNHYLFLANDGINGMQLWKTDGTKSGTQIVKIIEEGGISVRTMTVFNDKLYIAESDTGLWVSDGTEAGTSLVKSFDYTLDLRAIENGLIVSATDDLNKQSGYWLSDGTDVGTTFYHDRSESNLWLGQQIGNGSMFYESNGEGTFHYYTDGTSQGTKILETPDGLNLVFFDF